ncbi:hypothetical protein CISIN_1g011514mg [Citrus sinensis]|uniref:Major facilitator superfamily (MFS) profile domain-containing protein n=1 Tax=Citrus sinensis TaxID=2711 RepID=A0A067FLI6_CITSI|nr:hypothetical protein CISIN_1g011514mg [Citrus sinensis]
MGMEKEIKTLSHLFVTVFLWGFATMMVVPAITDVTMMALCPGLDECSLAIYLSGFQQAIIGLGTLVMMPVIGNLSDQYGRKAMLTLPLTLSIIPLAILAYRRSISFFYAYYALRTLTAMVCEGSINCLALAYVADNISERQRASAFGILLGVLSASFVCGTLAARFLSTTSAFQAATIVSMLAAAYMRVFLKDDVPNDDDDDLTRPIITEETEGVNQNESNSPVKIPVCKKIPSIRDLICLLRSSVTLSQAAVVAFFSGLSEGGMQASFLYFLKAQFHFNKNQFADLMLIAGLAGTISQLLFMPLLAPILGEAKLLSLGLFAACINMFICSISWSAWVIKIFFNKVFKLLLLSFITRKQISVHVLLLKILKSIFMQVPYATTAFSVLVVFATPSFRSIVSKQVGPNEQGKAQGCISGISSFANIVSPLIFSPLTALFLSKGAPFNFPGFSIMCIGLASMVAFIQSLMMSHTPASSKSQNQCCLA